MAVVMLVLGAALASDHGVRVLAQASLGLRDEGVGMYTDPSVAGQDSTFTITKNLISCGVGTEAPAPAPFNAGFQMLMFSLSVDSYNVVRSVPRTIRATGLMDSITRIGGVIVENTNGSGTNPPPHQYLAIAVDNDTQPDRFDIHFKTPFWNTNNPACTPSTVVPGGCRFGGDVFLGDVVVSPGQMF
jgi:hypothetical protein